VNYQNYPDGTIFSNRFVQNFISYLNNILSTYIISLGGHPFHPSVPSFEHNKPLQGERGILRNETPAAMGTFEDHGYEEPFSLPW
jgi:hypothetical protein